VKRDNYQDAPPYAVCRVYQRSKTFARNDYGEQSQAEKKMTTWNQPDGLPNRHFRAGVTAAMGSVSDTVVVAESI
jgi:hypothetical protein